VQVHKSPLDTQCYPVQSHHGDISLVRAKDQRAEYAIPSSQVEPPDEDANIFI